MEKHYTLLKAAQLLGVTTQTLRNWDNAGKLRTIRTPGNQRRIPESEIARLLGSVVNSVVSDAVVIEREPKRSMPEVQVNKDSYLLMCKDTAVYDITDCVILNAGLLPGCMLKGSKGFEQWLETRFCEETNFSSQRLMYSAFGAYDYEHAAFATGALSLSDCYWIRRSDEDILFADITPYVHKEWGASEESGVQNEYIWGSLSNLFTRGERDKCWIDAHSLLKINSFQEIEPFELCAAMGLENIANANLTSEGIVLSNFTSPDVFYESMEQYGTDEGLDPRDVMVKNHGEHAVGLFVVDYLVENVDRHADDYGFLRCAATGDYIAMAPYYNFDRLWSGEVITLPESALQGYRGFIRELCRRAAGAARGFAYGSIIERRAAELLRV